MPRSFTSPLLAPAIARGQRQAAARAPLRAIFSALMTLPALSLLTAPAPALAEVTESTPNGFVTREVAYVKASPYETWQALIAPQKWWSDRQSWSGDASNMYISAQADGCFCELLEDPGDRPKGVMRGSAMHMLVLQANPPKVLRMRGALGPLQSEPLDGVLTITLKAEGEGTRILWEYAVGGYMRYDTGKIASAIDNMLRQQLMRLAAFIGPMEAPSAGETSGGSSDSGGAADGAADDDAADDKTTDDKATDDEAGADPAETSEVAEEADEADEVGPPEAALAPPIERGAEAQIIPVAFRMVEGPREPKPGAPVLDYGSAVLTVGSQQDQRPVGR